MKKPYSQYKKCIISCFAACACITGQATAQQDTVRPNPLNNKQIVAGRQYSKSPFHQWLWGKHYRTEWNTPVTVPVLYLDTVAGGLIPYRMGGGRQSKNLHLHNPEKKEYVLRSIDKSFGRALPEIYRNTFIEKAVNDQVSIAHPYSAITIPPMAKAVGIYHTNPIIRYVPKQKALDTFNNLYGNDFYLLEQRPDENWEEADNFGNSANIISTEKLLEKLSNDNDNIVDQEMYVRARLFDMFIGDWGRHEDQWRWAAEKQGDKTIYKAIPRDRDQAYTKFDGIMLRMVIRSVGLKHLQSFDDDLKDVASFNFPARNLDRRMANETDLKVWVSTAEDMQRALTDEVIVYSIRLLPQEVYANSGDKIISILKSRRGKLVKFATEYYKFLADAVDIPGTEKNEQFEVTRVDDKQVKVSLTLAPGAPLIDHAAAPGERMTPFFRSLVAGFFVLFLATGCAYGVATGQIRRDRDVVRLAGEAIGGMAPYIVLAFVAAHFIAMFNWSNLGVILAIDGAQALRASGLPIPLLLTGIVLLALVMDIFIGSASAKWAGLAPVLVPMLMLLGVSPEMTTAAYRMGDAVINMSTPLMPYFPLALAFCHRWAPRLGVGGLLACTLPFSWAFLAAGLVLVAGWSGLGLPLGPGEGVHYQAPTAH